MYGEWKIITGIKSTKKTFLVLGTGNAQIDLLRLAQSEFAVLACSNLYNPRTESIPYQFFSVDITDKEGVLDIATEHKVDFIYSIGSDVAMPTLTWVNDALGLPNLVDHETAVICNNKNKLREKLAGIVGTIPHKTLDTTDLSITPLFYPIIVKPADSQGQRGVSLVTKSEELEEAFKIALKHSRNEEVIAERYVEGIEVSANVFLLDSEITHCFISDRISWPGYGGGLIHKHIFPSSIGKEIEEKIIELVKTTASRLGIVNGPAYYQIKIEDGKPYLIEVTPRLDGCHMWRLLKIATGVDLLEDTIKLLIATQDKDANKGIQYDGQWILEFFCSPPNTQFKSEKIELHKNCVYSELYYEEGETVRPINGLMEKCGYQIYFV